MKRYLIPIPVIGGLYLLNRLLLSPLTGSLFALGCGVFWEAVTPLYLPRSVGDPRDVLAVWLGAMAMLAVFRVTRK